MLGAALDELIPLIKKIQFPSKNQTKKNQKMGCLLLLAVCLSLALGTKRVRPRELAMVALSFFFFLLFFSYSSFITTRS
jgi:hypothetical protein